MPSEKKGRFAGGLHFFRALDEGLSKKERDKKFWEDVRKIDRKHLKEGLTIAERKILLDKIAFANTRDPKALERIEIEQAQNRRRRKSLKASMHSSVKK